MQRRINLVFSGLLLCGLAGMFQACGKESLGAKLHREAAGFPSRSLLAYNDPDDQVPELPDDPDDEQYAASDEYRTHMLAMQFEEPHLTPAEKQAVLKKYAGIDKTKQVPTELLQHAILYYHVNLEHIPNKSRITVIDYSRHSKFVRMFIVNMQTGAVWAMHVAHGKGSDADHDGIAEKFSNDIGSNATSLGFYLTGEPYAGKWGTSLYLDGLSTTNSNVRARTVVLHGAPYVQEAAVRQGRSWGCPAVSMDNRDRVISLLKGGSLMLFDLPKGVKRRSR